MIRKISVILIPLLIRKMFHDKNMLDEISVPLSRDKHNQAHTLNTFVNLDEVKIRT